MSKYTVLPDGTAFGVMSFPLPEKHWLTEGEHLEAPPMPFRMGTDDPRRQQFNEMIRAAARYAVRGSTMRGREMDFDPDAMVQNFVVAMLGYHTPDGLCHDPHVPDFDPNPVPPHYLGLEG